MSELKELTKFRRYLLEDSAMLIVRGGIAPVIAGMNTYNARYGIAPPRENLDSLIHELLAGAALSAVSLADRDSWGWSLTFKGMRAGFFVGVEPEGMICLRVVDADSEKSSCLIQRQKSGLPLTQSHITPRTRNSRDVVEQYFQEADQTKTRLVIRADGEGALLHVLPEGDFGVVKGLNVDELFSFIDGSIEDGKAREVGEVFIFYEFRCSEEMISRMVENMSESNGRDLFGDLEHLEIECPRCGRKYTVTRTDHKFIDQPNRIVGRGADKGDCCKRKRIGTSIPWSLQVGQHAGGE